MSRATASFDATTVSLLVGTLVLLAVGQVLFKVASETVDFSRPQSFLSPVFVVALVVYGAATLAWMVVLSRLPLSVAFPFYGLVFLIVPILAHFLLGEALRPHVILGGGVILIGVIISNLGNNAS